MKIDCTKNRLWQIVSPSNEYFVKLNEIYSDIIGITDKKEWQIIRME